VRVEIQPDNEKTTDMSRGRMPKPVRKIGSNTRNLLGAREQTSWYRFHGKRNEKTRENDRNRKKSEIGCN